MKGAVLKQVQSWRRAQASSAESASGEKANCVLRVQGALLKPTRLEARFKTWQTETSTGH